MGMAGQLAMERPLQWALDAGHEVVLLTPRPWRPAVQPRAGLQVISYSELDTPRQKARHAPAVERYMELLVGQIIVHFRVDLVHQYFQYSRIYPLLERCNRPMVVSAWGLLNDLAYPSAGNYSTYLARRLSEDAIIDALVVESPRLAAAATKRFPSIDRICMIPIGVDTSRFHPGWEKEVWIARHRYGIPDDGFVFLSARGWDAGYQHHRVLEAFSRACASCRGRGYLAFLGLPRNYKEDVLTYKQEVQDEAKRLGIAERVIWIQRATHDEMPVIYGLADAVVNFPKHDAFPATLQEALACERPVISADLPTYHDTPLRDHLTLVPPYNLDALAEAMVAATWEPSTRRRARMTAAREAIKEQYEERDSARRLMELYRTLAPD